MSVSTSSQRLLVSFIIWEKSMRITCAPTFSGVPKVPDSLPVASPTVLKIVDEEFLGLQLICVFCCLSHRAKTRRTKRPQPSRLRVEVLPHTELLVYIIRTATINCHLQRICVEQVQYMLSTTPKRYPSPT